MVRQLVPFYCFLVVSVHTLTYLLECCRQSGHPNYLLITAMAALFLHTFDLFFSLGVQNVLQVYVFSPQQSRNHGHLITAGQA